MGRRAKYLTLEERNEARRLQRLAYVKSEKGQEARRSAANKRNKINRAEPSASASSRTTSTPSSRQARPLPRRISLKAPTSAPPLVVSIPLELPPGSKLRPIVPRPVSGLLSPSSVSSTPSPPPELSPPASPVHERPAKRIRSSTQTVVDDDVPHPERPPLDVREREESQDAGAWPSASASPLLHEHRSPAPSGVPRSRSPSPQSAPSPDTPRLHSDPNYHGPNCYCSEGDAIPYRSSRRPLYAPSFTAPSSSFRVPIPMDKTAFPLRRASWSSPSPAVLPPRPYHLTIHSRPAEPRRANAVDDNEGDFEESDEDEEVDELIDDEVEEERSTHGEIIDAALALCRLGSHRSPTAHSTPLPR